MRFHPGNHWREIVVAGDVRSYLVHVPEGLSDTHPVRLILAFHGRGIDAEGMVRLCGMSELAEREGFIVVYPNGRPELIGGRGWSLDYDANALVTGSAELPFVEFLLDQLIREYEIDADHVYALGFSNGGMLCYALARWMSERFTAIGSVAGIVDFAPFELRTPISIIHIHGTRDRFIPFQGGLTARKDLPIVFPPVREMLDHWRGVTGCITLRHSEELIDQNDPTLVTHIEDFGPGIGNSSMKIVTVTSGGHTWPGRPPMVSYLGKWTTAFSASELITSFFRQAAISSR